MRVIFGTPALKWLCMIIWSLALWGCPEPEATPAGDCVNGQVTKCECDDGREGIKGCNNDLEFGDCHCLDADEIEELIGPDAGIVPVPVQTSDAGAATTSDGPCVDEDEDGFYDCIDPEFPQRPDVIDCDDNVWLRQPGGFEYPNNDIDDDCDGVVDERPQHCDCPLDIYNTSENLARAMNLCDGFISDFNYEGDVGQKLWTDDYETILPRAGGCVTVLSSGLTRRKYDQPTQKYTSSYTRLDGVLRVNFDANESGGSFKCQIDEGDIEQCTSPYTLPVLAPGIHELKIWAIDTSGLEDPIPLLYFWETYFISGGNFISPTKRNDFPIAYRPLELVWPLDSAILNDMTPAVQGFSAANRQVRISFEQDGEVVFTKVVNASDTGRWILDDYNWTTWGANMTLTPGNYLLRVGIAESTSGDVVAEEVLRMIEVSDSVGEASPFVSKIVSFTEVTPKNYEVTFGSDGLPTQYECRLDLDGVVGEWETCTSPHMLTNLNEGMNFFSIRAHSDVLIEPVPESRQMRVRAYPSEILSPADGSQTLEKLPAIFGRGAPGSSVQWTLSADSEDIPDELGMAATDFLGQWVIPLEDSLQEATYTLDVTYDYGEAQSTTDSATFTIDSSAMDTSLPLTVYYEGRNVQPGTNMGRRNDDPNPLDLVGATVRDLAVLELEITKPGNARGFSFDFMFLSAEFPEFMCKSFNDTFYAIIEADSINNEAPQNVSFDVNGNEVTVNNAFFEPGNGWTVDLSDSPFGGPRANYCGVDEEGGCYAPDYCAQPEARNVTGSGTGWLKTVVPLTEEDETFTISFSVHDEGDGIYDSTVMLDNFTWLTVADTMVTEKPTE